jgi:uncharacterized protein
MKAYLQRSLCGLWILVLVIVLMYRDSPALAQATPQVRETTFLRSSPEKLTVGSFNVENLDPGDGDRVNQLAKIIVSNLKQPDILSLIEVQDNNGAKDDGVTVADQTYQTLIKAIKKAGGAEYAFTDIAPQNNQDGGEPGGNIRPGFLYLPQRVTLVDHPKGGTTDAIAVVKTGSGVEVSLNPGRIEPLNPAFNDDPDTSDREGSRKPLVAEFLFNQQKFFIVANHFASKRGGDVAAPRRVEQAKIVNQFVKSVLAAEPKANVIVQGDLNDTLSSQTLKTLAGQELKNLAFSIPTSDRYSFVFRGSPELIDHILVSRSLAPAAKFDIVHVNAGFTKKASDHDPVLAQYQVAPASIPSPSPTPSESPSQSGQILPYLTGQALLDQLAAQYAPVQSYSYSEARDVLFGRISNQGGQVVDLYTGQAIALPTDGDPSSEADAKGFNTEHVWPQSKGAKNLPPKSDLHHLFPVSERVNSARGNKPFGDIPDEQVSEWYRRGSMTKTIPTQGIDDYSELGANQFEPREVEKGDVARAMFYFYTLYNSAADTADADFFARQRTTLCAWNQLDPPDTGEVARSHAIAASKQGNESPFVLDPTLAARGYCG